MRYLCTVSLEDPGRMLLDSLTDLEMCYFVALLLNIHFHFQVLAFFTLLPQTAKIRGT